MWDGSERRAMHRRARHSLTCIDEALKADPPPSKAVLEALRTFIIEQWLPHLEFVEAKAEQLDQMHKVSQRITIWLDGTCWVIKVLLPSLILMGGVILGLGKAGSHFGIW